MTTHQARTALDRPAAGKKPDGLLRLSLKLDAVASGALGVLMLLAGTVVGEGRPFVRLLGVPSGVMVSVGVFLVVFGLLVCGVGARTKISRPVAGTVVAFNALWVLLSVAVVLTGAFPLTTPGVALVVVQAAAVALFADLQFVGLRRGRPPAE